MLNDASSLLSPTIIHTWHFLPFRRLKCTLIFIILLFINTSGNAQVTDTTSKTDTTSVKKIKYHSPKKATLMSAIVPGLGQVYNKKYWKLPIIYGGFAALIYSLNFNQSEYVRFRDAYKYRIDPNPATVDNYVGILRDDDLFALQKSYNRYRDLSVIGLGLLYVLNVVDASVDAHLFTFDVGDDLSLNIHPTIINIANSNHYQTGLSLTIKL
jgi:Family of unknown function (DUF5683)